MLVCYLAFPSRKCRVLALCQQSGWQFSGENFINIVVALWKTTIR
uniref:Uncharacterized protein n=1 Tax=Arundo donax TaxID=35708 RepID=A0A0A9GPH6_ARUDO